MYSSAFTSNRFRMSDEKVSAAIKAGLDLTPTELTSFYDELMKTPEDYEKAHADTGYIGPIAVANHLAKMRADNQMKGGARILDVGAGSGLVGVELSKQKFSNVCAVDPSQGSLDVCKQKGCYREYLKSLVGPEKIPADDNTFDLAVSSGTFLPGHCDGTSLKEVVRVVKPGGRIVIALRKTFFADEHGDFDLRQTSDELVADKQCSLEQEDIENYNQRATGALLTYTVY